jgi:hypothetical protein
MVLYIKYFDYPLILRTPLRNQPREALSYRESARRRGLVLAYTDDEHTLSLCLLLLLSAKTKKEKKVKSE